MTKEDLRKDPLCNLTRKALVDRDPQVLLDSSVRDSKTVYREWNQMQLEDDIYQKGPSGSSEDARQLFLSERHRYVVPTVLHDDH